MTKKFECFIKFKDCKFDIVLRDQKLPEEKVNNVPITYIRFNIIYIKMAQIFQIALRTELDTVRYLFELTDSTLTKAHIVTSPETKVRHHSVITVRERPMALSRGRAFVNDNNIKFLEKQTKSIIAFHLMVDLIATNFRCHNFLRKADHKWKAVADRLIKSYPNIFAGTTPEKCAGLFCRCSYFYLDNFDKFNLKLEMNLQRVFDLLKIVHLLDADRIIKSSKRDLFAIIGQEQEIQDYVNLQVTHSFDMYLNAYRMFRQSITHDEFVHKYLLNNQQIITMDIQTVPISACLPRPEPDPTAATRDARPATPDIDASLITLD